MSTPANTMPVSAAENLLLHQGRIRPSRRVFNVLVALLVATVTVWFVCNFGRGPTRRALPWSASDVHEHHIDMFVDYAYYLEATLPEHDFHLYVRRLELKSWSEGDMVFSWRFQSQPPWWDPSLSNVGAYWRSDGDHFVVAKYENGRVYAQSFSF